MATKSGRVYNYATGGYVEVTKRKKSKNTKSNISTSSGGGGGGSSGVSATPRAKEIISQIDPREASKITNTVAAKSDKYLNEQIKPAYYEDQSGQGYSIAPGKLDTPQYVEKSTGLGVSIAQSKVTGDKYILKDQYTPPKRTTITRPIVQAQTVQQTATRDIQTNTFDNRATISAATPEMARATKIARIKETSGDVFGGLWKGFTFETPPAPSETSPTEARAYQIGLFGGLVTLGGGSMEAAAGKKVVKTGVKTVATKGDDFLVFLKNTFRIGGKSTKGKVAVQEGLKVAKATEATAATGQKVSKFKTVGTYVKNYAVESGKYLVGFEALKFGAEGVAIKTAPPEQKQIMQEDYFKQIVKGGYQSEREYMSNFKWYNPKNIIYQVPPFNAFSGVSGDAYKTSVEKAFKEQGLTDEQVQAGTAAALRMRKFKTGAETVGFLDLSRRSEKLGQKFVTNSFGRATGTMTKNQLFKKTFWRVGLNTGLAGTFEGGFSEYSQQRLREQDLSPGLVAINTGLGGGSAFALGGLIPAIGTKSKTGGKVVQIAAYVTDPYEWPGDVLASAERKAVSKITGKPYTMPVTFIQESVIKGKTGPKRFSFGTITEGGRRATAPINVRMGTQTTTQQRQNQRRAVFPFGNVLTDTENINNNVQDNITDISENIDNPIDTNQNITNNTNVFPGTNTNINPFTQVSTNTNTATFTASFSTVPVITPQLRIPPPLPLLFSPGQSYGKGSGRKRRTYVNEIKVAQGLLFGKAPAKRSKAKAKRRRKR